MRTGLSGSEYTLQPGDEHDFPDDEAIRLINAGYAVPVAGTKIETAVRPAPIEVRAADAAPEPVGVAKRPGKRR